MSTSSELILQIINRTVYGVSHGAAQREYTCNLIRQHGLER